jgi:hypothetical protein
MTVKPHQLTRLGDLQCSSGVRAVSGGLAQTCEDEAVKVNRSGWQCPPRQVKCCQLKMGS